MSHFIKKLIITGIAAVTALGVLTACTKMEESSENGESAAAEEGIPPAEGAEDKEAPAAEDEAAQDAQTDSGTDEGDVSGEAELMGLIEEVPEDSDDSFIIAKLVTEQIDEVDFIGTDQDDTKITVVYSIDTKFTKRTIKNGGEDVKEEEGSAADLKENFTVEMKGSYYEENVFFAADVEIVEVVTE